LTIELEMLLCMSPRKGMRWHEGRLSLSVVGVVGYLTDSPTPNKYWTDMKRTVWLG
jgi:hypothetical protein